MKVKLVLTYLLLLAVIIPWYWPAKVNLIYFGFPLWALISLAGGLVVSIVTAFVLLAQGPDASGGKQD